MNIEQMKNMLSAYKSLENGLVIDGIVLEHYGNWHIFTIYGIHRLPTTSVRELPYVIEEHLVEGAVIKCVITDCSDINNIRVAIVCKVKYDE